MILRVYVIKFNVYSPIISMVQILQKHFRKGCFSFIAAKKSMEKAAAEIAALPLIGNMQKGRYV